MPNFDFKVNKSNRYSDDKVKFFDDGLYYIRYCIMKETGEDISISILRLAFKYFIEYTVFNWIRERKMSFLNFGVFYTKWYPDCFKKTRKGEKIFIPSFPFPAINFSENVRRALKHGHHHTTAPEFLNAEKKDFKGLFHSIRLRDYDEFNLEKPPDETDLKVDFYSKITTEEGRIKVELD